MTQIEVGAIKKNIYLSKKFKDMSDHSDSDHSHDNSSDRPYFDESTSIIAPVFIALTLIITCLVLFL